MTHIAITHHSLRLRHATAPLQNHLIHAIGELLTNRAEEVPEDGYDRVDYRLELVFAAYDNEPDDPGQPVADLLTDLIHLCNHQNWDLHALLERADKMAAEEWSEWGDKG
jgi:hypothetical protein